MSYATRAGRLTEQWRVAIGFMLRGAGLVAEAWALRNAGRGGITMPWGTTRPAT
jgi:hypothetical protein